MQTKLELIETAARNYSDARELLARHVHNLQEKIEIAQRQHMVHIRRSLKFAAEREHHLRNLVTDSKDAFESPKTQTFHGIKVGWMKQKGKIEIADPEKTVQLAERLFADNPDLLDLIINTKKTPNKEAIADLPLSDAKKIGCEVKDAIDAIICKPVDDAVEKIVKAMLSSAVEEAAEA